MAYGLMFGSWYLSKGRVSDAYASLEQLRGKPLLAARDLYCEPALSGIHIVTTYQLLTLLFRHSRASRGGERNRS